MNHQCGYCGEPATIHETCVENGQVLVRHFCSAHGKDLIPAIESADHGAALRVVTEMYDRLSETEKNELVLLRRVSRRVV
jgi:hypothetical protein